MARVPLTAAQQYAQGTLSAAGALSATLIPTNTLDQSGATWQFRISPNSSVTPSTVSTTVTSTTQNLTTVLSAGITAPRFPAGPTAFGYADLEVYPNAALGATYYNTTLPGLRQFSLNGWTSAASGGTGTVTTFSATGTALVGVTVTNPTTTPALIMTVPAAPANSVWGNATGGSATPTYTSTPVVTSITGALVGNATTATTATNDSGGALGSMPYQTAPGTTAQLTGSTSSAIAVLTQTGTGSVSAAPNWNATTGTGLAVFNAAPTISGTATFSGAISLAGTITSPRWNPSGTAPTIAVGAGAGTGATASVLAGSTNAVGQLTVTSGTVPTPTSVIATITFNGTVSPAPRAVYLFPVNATAALDTLQVFSSIPSTTTWTINAGATGLTASLAHIWFYLVL